MTNKKKQRAKAVAAKTGVSYAGAHNLLNKNVSLEADVLLNELLFLHESFKQRLAKSGDKAALRVEFLGKNGQLTTTLRKFGQLKAESRKAVGERVNRIQAEMEKALAPEQKLTAATAYKALLIAKGAGEDITALQKQYDELDKEAKALAAQEWKVPAKPETADLSDVFYSAPLLVNNRRPYKGSGLGAKDGITNSRTQERETVARLKAPSQYRNTITGENYAKLIREAETTTLAVSTNKTVAELPEVKHKFMYGVTVEFHSVGDLDYCIHDIFCTPGSNWRPVSMSDLKKTVTSERLFFKTVEGIRQRMADETPLTKLHVFAANPAKRKIEFFVAALPASPHLPKGLSTPPARLGKTIQKAFGVPEVPVPEPGEADWHAIFERFTAENPGLKLSE